MPNPPQIVNLPKWKRIKGPALLIISLSVLVGLLYPVFGDGFGSIYPFINGLLLGFFGGICIIVVEFYLFYSPSRNTNFYVWVLFKILLYGIIFTLLLIAVVFISRSIEYNYPISLNSFFNQDEFQSFLYKEDFKIIVTYMMAFAIVILFIKEISLKLGRNTLFNFIIGKYHHPREEEKIFMFLDIDNSTSIAENMSGLKYHDFFNEFFIDITESILITKGEIYEYVGDEVVVSWTMKKGLVNENCMYTFFYAVQSIQTLADKYNKKYGIVPTFKAALHCGKVIRGEVGSIKSEIVFHGDVMNTTSRIERLCSKIHEPILLSEDLFEKMPAYIQKQFTSKGSHQLRGKEKNMCVFGLINKQKMYLDSN